MADSPYPRIPPRVNSWEELNRRVSDFTAFVLLGMEAPRLPTYDSASDVPASPVTGDYGLVTYGPAGGNGLYYYDGAAWQKVTVTAGTLP